MSYTVPRGRVGAGLLPVGNRRGTRFFPDEPAVNNAQYQSKTSKRQWPSLLRGMRPLDRTLCLRDSLAGIQLAAMSIPQSLGYASIAGMPAVTGLYTLFLPLLAFATFGASRYLVVAADSATAAILAGGVSAMAPVATARYVALAWYCRTRRNARSGDTRPRDGGATG
jgi:MFS superfamily sulfate permease-like transporter